MDDSTNDMYGLSVIEGLIGRNEEDTSKYRRRRRKKG